MPRMDGPRFRTGQMNRSIRTLSDAQRGDHPMDERMRACRAST
uniref:Uncharacterized protein n=1 Tax=Peronospora matthiolae TaxID=2874970 RepID=A0AAV1V4P7_9STRA